MLMEELSNFPEYDFLLYIHLLNLLDAYGQVDIMNKITLKTITTARNLDEAEKEVLDSFIVSAAPTTKDEMLLNLRELFIDYLIFNNVAEVTAENIIDAILDYVNRRYIESSNEKLILELNSFKAFIAEIMDLKYLDTYEYAACVLWGTVYMNDYILENNLITEQQYEIGRAHV